MTKFNQKLHSGVGEKLKLYSEEKNRVLKIH